MQPLQLHMIVTLMTVTLMTNGQEIVTSNQCIQKATVDSHYELVAYTYLEPNKITISAPKYTYPLFVYAAIL